MNTTTLPSFKFPSSFKPTPPTTTHLRQPSIIIVKASSSSSSAKYKGTQMREKKLTELIETKVAEATEICNGDRDSDECKVAWDEVEEISSTKADLRRMLEQNKDPLESFCRDHPETDECRIYE